MSDLVAVIDIGKTNSRVMVADPATGQEVWSRGRRNTPQADAPYQAHDTAAIEAFLLSALSETPMKAAIGTIVPVAHGACAALLAGNNLALPVIDYEEPALELVAEAYRPLRSAFAETGSPFLPLGLNVGRQLFFLERQFPQAFAKADVLLFWPQYWAWRFSGVKASEVTSLGCHNDLWNPWAARPSGLAEAKNWARLFPPLRKANEVVGTITPEVAAATGLNPATQVVAGIHDSNASFLRHRVSRPHDLPFVVLSSGTWAILLASGGAANSLDEARDCIVNVDALDQPVPCARFMGGREYEVIASHFGQPITPPGFADLDRVLAAGAMALPSFSSTGGPFQGKAGRLENASGLDARAGAALASLYIALVSDVALDLLSAHGDIVIEGPFAEDRLIGPIMASLRPGQQIFLSADHSGSLGGALWLAGATLNQSAQPPVKPVDEQALADYRREWRARAEA